MEKYKTDYYHSLNDYGIILFRNRLISFTNIEIFILSNRYIFFQSINQ